jgi:D-arginine dehydrogenase
LVIGGGIAGVAAGYYLALEGHEVVLAEQETTLAFHSTGRSAALIFENYGAIANRPLTAGSLDFFRNPPALVEHPLIAPRGAMWVGRPEQLEHLRSTYEQSHVFSSQVDWLAPSVAASKVPVLRTEYLGGAIWEPEPVDIDVASVHQAFVRGLRTRGGHILTKAPVTSLHRDDGRWLAKVADDVIGADVVVNAAGAWADAVADLAGARRVGLQPLRRTAFMVPGSLDYADWPLVCDIDNEFYFRPDGSQLLCSLADETPSEPCDARPEELDIALAIDRINTATTLGIRTVRSSWAGLRSFVTDRAMVLGFDPVVEGFFWLAGQGGTGIQTAPAAGRLTAAMIGTGEPSPDLIQLGLDVAALSPGRFENPA